MKTKWMLGPFLLLVACVSLLGGCAPSQQARKVDPREGVLLSDYTMLREGKNGEALWVYKNAQIDWDGYRKVLVERVLFPMPENASAEGLADLQKLASNFQVQMLVQIGKEYEVVTVPGPNTLRVQTAFFDAAKKKEVGNLMSSVSPPGIAASLVNEFATGEPLAVGEISGEALLTDAQSGVLLAVALDHRVGQKYSKGMFDSWAEANDAVEYWAKRIRFALCQARGRGNCEAP